MSAAELIRGMAVTFDDIGERRQGTVLEVDWSQPIMRGLERSS